MTNRRGVLLFALLTFSVPSLSLAAPLTQAQAQSLIGVVQSSPNTPASVFTSFITSFSNITIAQAESLITVVQSAPGVAANAFVNLLVSFTQDTTVAAIQPATPTIPEQIAVQQTPVITAPSLSLSFGQVTKTKDSARIQWTTAIPSESKVFLTEAGSTNTRVLDSQSGLSANHFVSIDRLTPSTTYKFIIEALAGIQDQKYSDLFTTDALPPAPQFTQVPTFEKAESQLRVSWKTDITSDSRFYICMHGSKQWQNPSPAGCTPQTQGPIPTSGSGSISNGQYFAIYVPAYTTVMFYVVEISANGQSVYSGGQIPQL